MLRAFESHTITAETRVKEMLSQSEDEGAKRTNHNNFFFSNSLAAHVDRSTAD